MKYAGFCFGCLALFFLIMMVATGPILVAIANADQDLAMTIAPFSAYVNYLNSGCCCLSGVLAIVFLAVGFMGGNKDPAE